MQARDATVLRDLQNPLFGKRYKAGEIVPAALVAKMPEATVRNLMERGILDVPGMSAEPMGAGQRQHLMARLDSQADQIKALTARLDALEGKAPEAAPTVSPTRRGRRAKATQE